MIAVIIFAYGVLIANKTPTTVLSLKIRHSNFKNK